MIRRAIAGLVVLAAFAPCACSSGSPGSGDAATGDAYSATDPHSAARATCVAEINRLRATHGLPPYAQWTGVEACVDGQATSDEMTHTAHMRWRSGVDTCNGNAQNECLGQGVDGIVRCLDAMWDERLQPECAGCDACAGHYTPSCPNCDYAGTSGHVCGHYVNMSARWLSGAACGFSSLGGWDVINFH